MPDTAVRFTIANPAGPLKVGAGLQEFRVRVRKVGTATSHPSCKVELYEAGGTTPLATPISSTSVSSTTGVVLSGTWNANLLADISGAQVEAAIVGIGITDGSVEPDGFKWLPSLAYTRTINDHANIFDTYAANGVPGDTGTVSASGDDVVFDGVLTWITVEGDDLVFDASGPVTVSGDDVIFSG